MVLLSRGSASKLCLSFSGRVIHGDKDIVAGLVNAGSMYIIRSDVLRHLISKGLRTYSPFMYFY